MRGVDHKDHKEQQLFFSLELCKELNSEEKKGGRENVP